MSEQQRGLAGNRVVLTIPEVAKILEIGRASAYNLAKQQGFPSIRIGRQLRVPEEALRRWINSQTAS